MKILFLDTETTALKDGRIVQLAYKNRGDTNTFVEYYKPPVPIEFGAMGTHHITEEMVADKPAFPTTTTAKELPEMLTKSILVAHNAIYDISILKTEGVETNQYICTYKVAYHLYDYPDYKLQSLRYRWGIKIDDAKAHDALGDVAILEAVFEHMVKEYTSKNNLTEEQTIQKFIEITKEPALLRRIGFGKHKGMSFDEIRKSNFSYLEWIKNKMEDKNEDLVFTVDYHLAKASEDSPF